MLYVHFKTGVCKLKKTNAGVNANIVIFIAIVIALGVNGTLELLSVVD